MYAKIYRSLWEGSMRGHGVEQLVLVYLCAHSDANGIVDIIHDRIAADIGFPVQQVRSAILRLEAADPRSRSPEARGARLARLDEHRDWGWLIVNYDKYRTANDLEKIKEQNRLRARAHRERLRSATAKRHAPSRDVTLLGVTAVTSRDCHAKSRQAVSSKQKQEAEAEKHVDAGVGASVPLFDADAIPPLVKDADEMTSEQAFDEVFWRDYPRKTAKQAARKAWNALKLKDQDQETFDAIMAGLKRDLASEWKGRPMDKIPHASTWLNQRRWEDHQ